MLPRIIEGAAVNRQKEESMNSDYPSGGSDNGATGSGGMGSAGMYSSDPRMSSQSEDMYQESGADVRSELSALKADLDALMARASTLTDSQMREARDRIMARYESLRFSAKGFADQASEQFNQSIDMTSDYVKEKPLQSVAIAAGVGMLLGALLRR